MQIDLAALPDDPATLQQMLREMVAAAEQQQTTLQDAVQQRDAEIDKLHLLIKRLLRQQFGRRSEQLSADQLQLALEDLEQTAAANEAARDAAENKQRQRRETRPNRNHGALPSHLPRYEVLIDVEHRDCPCCGGAMHAIGELRSEQLDIVPAQLRVRVTRRPRYACRTCEGAVVVAPAPERPIDGGMATEALVAHVLVSKFCDSLPLYRKCCFQHFRYSGRWSQYFDTSRCASVAGVARPRGVGIAGAGAWVMVSHAVQANFGRT